MSSPNKLCSQDNLERVIDMQHCDPLLPLKGHEANPTELFQAVVLQSLRKWQALWRRTEKYDPATMREAQIVSEVLGHLLFNSLRLSNRPPSSKEMEDRSSGKKSLGPGKSEESCRISVVK